MPHHHEYPIGMVVYYYLLPIFFTPLFLARALRFLRSFSPHPRTPTHRRPGFWGRKWRRMKHYWLSRVSVSYYGPPRDEPEHWTQRLDGEGCRGKWGWQRWVGRYSRVQVLVGGVWVVYVMVASAMSIIPFPEPNEYRPHVWILILGNRFGVLAFQNLPLVFLLGMRMNPLVPLTGIELKDFNNFHRFIGSGVFILGFLHVILLFVFIAIDTDLFWVTLVQPYILAGLAATLAFFLICGPAAKKTRMVMYEVFLWLHVVMSAVLIVGCFYHWRTLGIWPTYSLLIWATDRLARLLSVYWTHTLRPRRLGGEGGAMKARVKVLDERCVSVEIPVEVKGGEGRGEVVKWEVGGAVWVGLKGLRRGRLQWHPYTISNTLELQRELRHLGLIDKSQPFTMRLLISRQSGFSALMHDMASSASPSSSPALSASSHSTSATLNPSEPHYSGLTLTNPVTPKDAGVEVDMWLEGPYGLKEETWEYETVMLFAGGSGVTAMWSRLEGVLAEALREVRERGKEEGGEEEGLKRGRRKRVVLVWAVKHLHHTLWLPLKATMEVAASVIDLSVLIYSTDSSPQTPAFELAKPFFPTPPDSPKSYHSILPDTGVGKPLGISFHAGRPDVEELIREERGAGKMLILACGPVGLGEKVVSAGEEVGGEESGGDVVVKFELYDL